METQKNLEDEDLLEAKKSTEAKASTSRVRMRIEHDTTSAARKLLNDNRSRAA